MSLRVINVIEYGSLRMQHANRSPYSVKLLDGILINEIQTVLHGGLELLTFKLFQLLDGILINEIQTFLHDELELLTIKLVRMLADILINEIETIVHDELEFFPSISMRC